MAVPRTYVLNCRGAIINLLKGKANVVFVGDSKTETSYVPNLSHAAFGEWPINWTGYYQFARMGGNSQLGSGTYTVNGGAITSTERLPGVAYTSTGQTRNVPVIANEILFNSAADATGYAEHSFGVVSSLADGTRGNIAVKKQRNGWWPGKATTIRMLWLNAGSAGAPSLQVRWGRGSAYLNGGTVTSLSAAGTSGTIGTTDISMPVIAAVGTDYYFRLTWQTTTGASDNTKYLVPLGAYFTQASTDVQQARMTHLAFSGAKTVDWLTPGSALQTAAGAGGVVTDAQIQAWLEAQWGTGAANAPTLFFINLGSNQHTGTQPEYSGGVFVQKYYDYLQAIALRMLSIAATMGSPNAKVVFITDWINNSLTGAADSAQTYIRALSAAYPDSIGVLDVWQHIKDNIGTTEFRSATFDNAYSYDGLHATYSTQEWLGRTTWQMMMDSYLFGRDDGILVYQ